MCCGIESRHTVHCQYNLRDVTEQSRPPLKSSSMSGVDDKLASQLAVQIFLALDINSACLMPVAMQVVNT